MEFELFQSGEKDIVYFSFVYQPEGHIELAKSLGAEVLTFDDPEFKLPNYIYYRSGFLNEAMELKELLTSSLNMHQSEWPEKEHRIGHLLGYSKQDVEVYINRFRATHEK